MEGRGFRTGAIAVLAAAAAISAAAVLAASCTGGGRAVVGSVVFDENGEWFEEAIAGMRGAAEELGVTLVERNSHYDLGAERELVLELLGRKARAVVICPLSSEETGRTLGAAARLRVPVVTWNTTVTPAPAAQIVVDSRRLGAATGEHLAAYVERNGLTGLKAALITNDSYTVGAERCEGFRSSIEPLVESGALEIVSEIRCELSEETRVRVQRLLDESPEVNLVWCWNQTSLTATVDVLKAAGRTDVLVAGTDMSVGVAREMLSEGGQIIAVTSQQPYRLGYEAVANAVRAAAGGVVERTVEIPTITYTREDAAYLRAYIEDHEKFERK